MTFLCKIGALSIHGGTRLATAPRKAEDAYISYAMKGNMQDSVHMPDSSCYLSILVLPMALDMKSHLYESFEVTLARANTWLYASQASGVPIKLMSVQSDDLLTKVQIQDFNFMHYTWTHNLTQDTTSFDSTWLKSSLSKKYRYRELETPHLQLSIQGCCLICQMQPWRITKAITLRW